MAARFSTNHRAQHSANGAARRERARATVNGTATTRRRRQSPPDRFVLLPSFHSEKTREALLQSGPGKRADRMTVAYHSSNVEFELSARGSPLLAGAIESELVVDGLRRVPAGNWESVCWYADDDGDFVELQLSCEGSIRIGRQFLLSRRGHFALIADAVFSPAANRLEYRVSLPTAEGVLFRPDALTRECRLMGTDCAARAFPVGLPQSRVTSAAGDFAEREGYLDLTQEGAGKAQYACVALDWHPTRRRTPAEWRSLTVTELGSVVPPDCAAGFRLRIGKHQLLIYRSLFASEEARAVLGHHTRYETVVGTFDSAGEVEPIVMVERE